MLIILDLFFTYFHIAFILFVLMGWSHRKTRKVHIMALLSTLIAWLLIGFYTGTLGYCPLTDWHWDVKRTLGEQGMSGSFVEYVLEKSTGINFPRKLVDAATAMGLLFGITMAFVKGWKVKILLSRKNQTA